MTKNKSIPTEDQECKALVDWLRIIGLPHHHSANEVPIKKITGRGLNGKPIWGSNWTTLRRLKDMGVSKGFPDYIVVIPTSRSKSGKSLLLAIEMKRLKGGVTSSQQKEWLQIIGQIADCEGFVCKGADEAIKTVKQFIN